MPMTDYILQAIGSSKCITCMKKTQMNILLMDFIFSSYKVFCLVIDI